MLDDASGGCPNGEDELVGGDLDEGNPGNVEFEPLTPSVYRSRGHEPAGQLGVAATEILLEGGAVHLRSWVPQQVAELLGPRHDADAKLASVDGNLGATQAGFPVASQCSEDVVTVGREPHPNSFGQIRRVALEVTPGSHRSIVASYKPVP